MLDDEILTFAVEHDGNIPSVLPVLDHLARLHPEMAPGELVAQVDAAIDRMYRAGRAFFAGHRWLMHERPPAVAGFLMRRLGELHYDAQTRTWSWTGTQWTDNITVR
ncbi:MAG: hypothetical protein HOV81_19675 [Kofleriaceae bacterium]|nr:hypothetical protein [Kofleriaceae bacterium]